MNIFQCKNDSSLTITRAFFRSLGLWFIGAFYEMHTSSTGHVAGCCMSDSDNAMLGTSDTIRASQFRFRISDLGFATFDITCQFSDTGIENPDYNVEV